MGYRRRGCSTVWVRQPADAREQVLGVRKGDAGRQKTCKIGSRIKQTPIPIHQAILADYQQLPVILLRKVNNPNQLPITARKPEQRQASRHSALRPCLFRISSLFRRPCSATALMLLLIVDFNAGLPAGFAQTTKSSKATVREILDRQELFINRRRAKVKDTAQQPDSLRTLQCRAQLGFADGTGGRMIKASTIRLGECLFISQGSVLISGPMCACSSSLRVCSKNTNYILEVMDDGDAAVTSLEGTLDVQPLDSSNTSSTTATIVNSGQRLRFYQEQGFTTIVELTADDYARIINGPLFKGFRERLPNQGALEDYLQEHVPEVSLPKPEPIRNVNTTRPLIDLLPMIPAIIDFIPGPGDGPRRQRRSEPYPSRLQDDQGNTRARPEYTPSPQKTRYGSESTPQ